MKNLDLFGDSPEEVVRSKHYVKPKGYAGNPGAGPDGETCRTCEHRVIYGYHGRTYPKCGLVPHKHSRSNDILVSSPACQFWEKVK